MNGCLRVFFLGGGCCGGPLFTMEELDKLPLAFVVCTKLHQIYMKVKCPCPCWIVKCWPVYLWVVWGHIKLDYWFISSLFDDRTKFCSWLVSLSIADAEGSSEMDMRKMWLIAGANYNAPFWKQLAGSWHEEGISYCGLVSKVLVHKPAWLILLLSRGQKALG